MLVKSTEYGVRVLVVSTIGHYWMSTSSFIPYDKYSSWPVRRELQFAEHLRRKDLDVTVNAVLEAPSFEIFFDHSVGETYLCRIFVPNHINKRRIEAKEIRSILMNVAADVFPPQQIESWPFTNKVLFAP